MIMPDFKNIADYGRKHLGWDETETKYTVVQTVTFHYEVTASSPDSAAAAVSDGDAGTGECQDSTIEKVVHSEADTFDADDLREPRKCLTCETMIDPRFSMTTCNECFFQRVNARRAAACPCCSHTEGRHYDGCLEASE